jgi:hypothetical protein
MANTSKKDNQKFQERLKHLLNANQDTDYVGQYVKGLQQEDGKAHITVDLRRGFPVFAPYSSKKDLSPEIFTYVEGVAKYLKVSQEVAVDFLILPEQSDIAENVKNEFYGNYRFELDEKREEVHKIKLQSLYLMIIGVFLLIVCSAFGYFGITNNDGVMNIVSQIVSIASWVFIWAAVEKFYFDRTETNKEALRSAQLADASLNFIVQPLEKE